MMVDTAEVLELQGKRIFLVLQQHSPLSSQVLQRKQKQ